jgi:two-component system OmpR family response regulator
MRALLIEDDAMIGQGLVRALGDAGWSVDWARTGSDGEEALRAGGHAVALLDLGLPEKTGLEVLAAIRKAHVRTPLIVITAQDDLETRLAGLDLGADDYLVKPFDSRELMARIRAVLRRRVDQAASIMSSGEVDLDLSSHVVTYRGMTHLLPAREFALMQALVEHQGNILSKVALEERLYGWGEEVQSNAVEVLIHYIRRKFDKDIIRNVRGAGWTIPKAPP